jgi:hypothetical protein
VETESLGAAEALLDGHPHLAMPGASIELLEQLPRPGGVVAHSACPPAWASGIPSGPIAAAGTQRRRGPPSGAAMGDLGAL